MPSFRSSASCRSAVSWQLSRVLLALSCCLCKKCLASRVQLFLSPVPVHSFFCRFLSSLASRSSAVLCSSSLMLSLVSSCMPSLCGVTSVPLNLRVATRSHLNSCRSTLPISLVLACTACSIVRACVLCHTRVPLYAHAYFVGSAVRRQTDTKLPGCPRYCGACSGSPHN